MRRTPFIILAISVSVRVSVFLWQALHPLPFNPTLQNFEDFSIYYLKELALLSQGYLPYRDFPYSYPPLFLYVLAPFYRLGSNAAAIPIILADALSAPLVYLILRRNSTETLAIVASIAYVVSPFFVVYEGLSWLSEQPMLFSLLLCVYLLLEGRIALSSAAFAIALLFKQDAIFMFPAFAYWAIRLYGARSLALGIGIVAGVVGIVSLPFLILAPVGYLYSLTLGHLFPNFHPLMSLPSSSGVIFASGFTATNATLPNLTCSYLVNNPLQISQVCTGVEANGSTLTNWLGGVPAETSGLLRLITMLLLVPLIPEIALLKKVKHVNLSLTACVGAVLALLVFGGYLIPYKYYFVPYYALLLVSGTTGLSVATAILAPVVTLAMPSYTPVTAATNLISTSIISLVALHFVVGFEFLRSRSAARTDGGRDRIGS